MSNIVQTSSTDGAIRDSIWESVMPRMFRLMKKDDDDKPTIGVTATTLGVRLTDIDLDAQDNVVCNDKGMSVRPSWRDAPLSMIPKRLGTGGRGSDKCYCFRRGEGDFVPAPCGAGMELLPDGPTHGVVRPVQLTPLATFQSNLQATRPEREIDEN
jgi:hypothetical protein